MHHSLFGSLQAHIFFGHLDCSATPLIEATTVSPQALFYLLGHLTWWHPVPLLPLPSLSVNPYFLGFCPLMTPLFPGFPSSDKAAADSWCSLQTFLNGGFSQSSPSVSFPQSHILPGWSTPCHVCSDRHSLALSQSSPHAPKPHLQLSTPMSHRHPPTARLLLSPLNLSLLQTCFGDRH